MNNIRRCLAWFFLFLLLASPCFADFYFLLPNSSNGVEKISSTGVDQGVFGQTGDGNLSTPLGIATDASGNIYVTSLNTNTIQKFSSTGADLGTFASGLNGPRGVIVNYSTGNVFVANLPANTVLEYSSTGTLLGTVADVSSGNMNPRGFAFDAGGNLYFSVGDSKIYKVTPSQISTAISSGTALTPSTLTIFASPAGPFGIAFDANGNLDGSSLFSNTIFQFSSTGASNGNLATGVQAQGIIVDASGNVYVVKSSSPTAILEYASGCSFPCSASTFLSSSIIGGHFITMIPIGPTVWNGGGSTRNLSNEFNWASGAPFNSYDIQFAGSANTSPNNDVYNNFNSITFNSGASPFTLTGNGFTLANGITNNSSSTQSINLGSNTLTLGASQIWNASAGNLTISNPVDTGSFALTLTGANTTTLSGAVSDTGSLIMTGSGTLVLSGANTYSGGTTITNGTVQAGVNGLGTGNVSLTSGTLQAAGASAQQINVGGTYSQTGGMLALRIGTTSDQLAVGRTATLGGALSVTNLSGFSPTAGQTFPLITAGGTSGTFSSFTAPGTSPMLAYSSTGVSLIYPSFSPANGLGFTANQSGIGGAVVNAFSSATGSGTTLITNLNALPPNQVAGALSQLSPQRAQLLGNIALQQSYVLGKQLEDHIQGLRVGESGLEVNVAALSAPGMDESLRLPISHFFGLDAEGVSDVARSDWQRVPDQQWSFFLRGDLTSANLAQQTNLTGSSYRTGGMTAGFDYRLTDKWAAGLLFAYAHTDANLDTQGSLAHEDSYTPGLYATYMNGPFYLDFLASYGVNGYQMNRIVTFPGFSQSALSQEFGDQYELDARGGYDCKLNGWMIGPRFALQSTNLDVSGYTETGGGAANLAVGHQYQGSLRSQLGFRLMVNDVNLGEGIISPYLDVRWQHEYLSSQPIEGQFGQSAVGSFIVNTDNLPRNAAIIDVGLTANVSRAWKLFFDYAMQAGQSSFFAQDLSGGFKISW